MASSATSKTGEGRTVRIWSVLCFSVTSYLVASFLSSFLLGLFGLAIDRFSASPAVAIPSTCRILSSGVDLKASKVCKLGTLNYKSNSAFYHLKKATFRCHYDYYWASIFEVQFEEYFSGQIFHAVAEAPKEALPHDCRPDFGTAWLTTMKFRVNETYGCKYQLGSRKVDIDSNGLFGCKAKQSSTSDTIMTYINLLMRFFMEIEGPPGSNIMYAARGFFCGILISMLTVVTAKCFRILAGAMSTLSWRPTCIIVQLRRVCILVAYISVMAWLILQYGKMIGLNQLLFDSKTYEKKT